MISEQNAMRNRNCWVRMHVLIVQHISNDFTGNITFKVMQWASLNCDANQMSIVLLINTKMPSYDLVLDLQHKRAGIHISIMWLLVKAFFAGDK